MTKQTKQSWWQKLWNRREKSYVSAVQPLASYQSGDPAWVFTFKADDPEASIKASPWVYACLDKIMSAAMAVPLIVTPKGHGLETLLKQPIPGKPTAFWLGVIAMLLKLDGTVYLYKVRATALGKTPEGNGVVKELLPIQYGTITPTTTTNGLRKTITGWTITGTKTTIPLDDIIAISLPSPASSFRGLSPVEACQREISTDRQAAEWQTNSLQNRAVPDGVFVSKEFITDEERTEFEETLRERWTNMQKGRAPFLLGSDANFIPTAHQTAVELDLVEGRRFNREAIASTFGVPSILLNAENATYANYETAQLTMWEFNTWQMFSLILGALQVGMEREYAKAFVVDVQYSEVDAMLPAIKVKMEVAKQMKDLGQTNEQINAFLGLNL